MMRLTKCTNRNSDLARNDLADSGVSLLPHVAIDHEAEVDMGKADLLVALQSGVVQQGKLKSTRITIIICVNFFSKKINVH